jgi:hypothetical protein
MADAVSHLASIAAADRTRRAQDAVMAQTCAYFLLQRRHPKRPAALKQAARELHVAHHAYEIALETEVRIAHARPTNLHPAPLGHTAAVRAKLWLRGGCRLGVGIGLGIVWASAGACVFPVSAREGLRHFALHTCCAGGVADIKRAGAPASKALKYKRLYQMEAAEHAGYMAGCYAPMPPLPEALMSGGLAS